MTRRRKRLALIGSALAVVGLALGLVLFALRDNVVFFYSPTELTEKNIKTGVSLRVGGLVKNGSLVKQGHDKINFVVTDLAQEVRVSYTGLLPDLFREGQGVVIEGMLDAPGQFLATTVLAKHDETYMPRDVADKLKAQGVWKGAGAAQGDAKSTP
jgi:cytochrome c-type biogenesis protein CcmE